MIDSHCHLDWKDFQVDLDSVINRATIAGVEKMIHVALLPDGLESGRKIVNRFQQIYWAAGCHPHDADKWTKTFDESLREAAKHPKFVAIGEIGLDFFKKYSGIKNQENVFRIQLELAKELDLPVIIHCRDAYSELFKILTEFSSNKIEGVIHCFSGNLDDAQRFIDLGMFISFAGHLTYKKNEELRNIAKTLPLDKILIETDSPFLAPQFKRGKRNEPAYVAEVLKLIASLKNVDVSEADKIISENTLKLFNIK